MRNVDIGWGRRGPGVLSAFVLVLALLAGCSRPGPEQALRTAFDGLQGAIEARDARRLSNYLTADFIGPRGMDRDEARRIAALYFVRHADIGVLPGPLQIDLQESHARVRFNAVVAGGEGGRLLPDDARAWQVDTGWRLVDGDWRMVSADWSPALR